MKEWLEPSFWALPENEHRQMFLDAATVMHEEPAAHLRATWVALVQLDLGPMTHAAAEFAVSSLLAELLSSSLVSISTMNARDWLYDDRTIDGCASR